MSGRWQQALAEAREGRRSWRGLDELAHAPDFAATLGREFDLDRRGLLSVFGASLALAGLAGCEASPDDRARPYVLDPENQPPGEARLYATALPFAGIMQPVLGVTYAGRPTKLEGNPDHPASRGATDAFTQAALLDLYDPQRSQTPVAQGNPTGWADLDAALAARAALADANQGEGFRLLTGAVTSPTLLRQIARLRERWPAARWHRFEPVDDSALHAATARAFGRPLDVTPLLHRAHMVVAFDADPLGPGPRQVRDSLAWSARRRAFQAGDGGASLMVAEPSPTLTGARSHDRLAAAADRIPLLVAGLARIFGVRPSAPPLTIEEQGWIDRAAKRLAATRGRGLVLAGSDQPAETQALCWAIDERLGNLAETSRCTAPVRPSPAPEETLAALVADMAAGRVRTLAILDANPVYANPLGPAFAAALARVEFSLHAGLWRDETGAACRWHAPLAHPLESWSDGRTADGGAVIGQPLLRPLYEARPLATMLAALGGEFGASDHDLVRETWPALAERWDEVLVKGVVPEEPPEPVAPPRVTLPAAPPSYHSATNDLELLVRPDPTIWDGRLANNPWAQEAPKPLTTLTWDNAVLIAPALAAQLGLEDGDEVRVARGDAAAVGPVWVLPGQAARTVLVHLGYGRRFGDVAQGAGFDATPLLGRAGRVTLAPTGKRRALAAAQEQQAIDGEGEAPVRTVDYLDTAPKPPVERPPSFWADKPARRPSWGMSIDLDLCTGCGACVTACIAENNIPMVGREAVRNGRRMHWLRIDRYYQGPPDRPALHSQPVPCMHCEDAPCEMGCPVNAAVHSPEGLNLQVYNRCIGTRTCSSYCPYKVRRFNWDDYQAGGKIYAEKNPESVKAQRNPNVTVRARGVMEKCTYCIQRISAARIAAKIAGAPIADGAVRTACQQVCPTGAISFGDIADAASEVVRRKAGPRDYALLEKANTRPRTTYRARIRSESADG